EYLRTLRTLLRWLDVCDGNMEEGSLRCDANVSLRPVGAAEYGTKAEIKNMNSFRHVREALEYEVGRQSHALVAGERLVQETRLWNPGAGHTPSTRSQENDHHYAYLPAPDPVAVQPDPRWVAELEAQLPELPHVRRRRFTEQYALSPYDADLLTGERALADYYEAAVQAHASPKALANWILTELLRELAGDPAAVSRSPIRPEALARLVALIDDGTISGKMAKDVFAHMWRTGEAPEVIVEREGLRQVADADTLATIVDQVIHAHPAVVA